MKYRKLRIAFSVACGIACVLLVVLWVRSYLTFDRLTGQLHGRNSYMIISYAGDVIAVYVPMPLDRRRIVRDSGPVNPDKRVLDDEHWPAPSFLGFGWLPMQSYSNMPNGYVGWYPEGLHDRSWTAGASGVKVPYWSLALFAAAAGALPWIRWRFSLRTLLIATTLVAVVLGLIVYAAR